MFGLGWADNTAMTIATSPKRTWSVFANLLRGRHPSLPFRDDDALVNRTARIALPTLVVLAVLGWVGYQYFIVADSPDEVSTDAALVQLTEDLAEEASVEDSSVAEAEPAPTAVTTDTADESAQIEPSAAEPAPAAEADESQPAVEAPAAAGVTGLWTIDDEFGDFSFDNASGSFAGFRVDKELFVGGLQVAVGRTGDVTGSLTIADGALTAGEVVVTTTTMQSDIASRANSIKDAIRASEFPTASFTISEPTAIDTAALAGGETVPATITGDLTIAGVTKPVAVSVEATVVEAGIGLIVGTADLVWADFGVATPNSSAGTVADSGVLEFQLIVRAGA